VVVKIGRAPSARSPYLAMDKEDSEFEGGQAIERCYSFLKPGLAARRAWARPVARDLRRDVIDEICGRQASGKTPVLACFDRSGCWPSDRRMQGTVAPNSQEPTVAQNRFAQEPREFCSE